MEQSLADLVHATRDHCRRRVRPLVPSRPAARAARARRAGPICPAATAPRRRSATTPRARRAPARRRGVSHGRPQQGDQALAICSSGRRSRARLACSPAASRRSRTRPKKQEIVGLKVGASQIAASRIVNDGSAKLVQLARTPLAPGIVVAGEVRDVPALGQALDDFFTEQQAAASRHSPRHRHEPRRCPHARRRRDRRRAPARQRGALPRPRGALDPDRPGRARLPRDRRDGRRIGRAVAARRPRGRVPRADRPLHRGLPAREAAARRDRPRGLRTAAGGRARVGTNGAGAAALVALSLGHDRSTLAISDGSICDFTRVLEWGGGKLETAIGRDLGLTGEEAAELKHQVSLETRCGRERRPACRTRRAPPFSAKFRSLARELVASLQFYQTQPGSLADRRDPRHRRAPASCPGSSRSSSG